MKGLNFNKSIAIFLTSSIVIYALAISFQCDDYHNRFALSIYPFFVILAARATEYFISGFLTQQINCLYQYRRIYFLSAAKQIFR